MRFEPIGTPDFSVTTLNAIPVDQAFRGDVWSQAEQRWISGVFWKYAGSNWDSRGSECLVIKLDDGANHPVWLNCRTVRNYKPLKVVLKEIQ